MGPTDRQEPLHPHRHHDVDTAAHADPGVKEILDCRLGLVIIQITQQIGSSVIWLHFFALCKEFSKWEREVEPKFSVLIITCRTGSELAGRSQAVPLCCIDQGSRPSERPTWRTLCGNWKQILSQVRCKVLVSTLVLCSEIRRTLVFQPFYK